MRELVASLWFSRIAIFFLFCLIFGIILGSFFFANITPIALIFLAIPVVRNCVIVFSQDTFALGQKLPAAFLSTSIFLLLAGVSLFLLNKIP